MPIREVFVLRNVMKGTYKPIKQEDIVGCRMILENILFIKRTDVCLA